jgi:hypothetical protein
MKIEIEISDFYLEDEELETGLKEYIKSQTINAIWKKIETKVDDHLKTAVKEQVEKLMYQKMGLFIDDFINVGLIKSSISSNQVNIKDYIIEKFKHDSGWASPDNAIKKLAQSFANEMKDRYDLMFASQLVAKMNENGMLKEDVGKLLLEK